MRAILTLAALPTPAPSTLAEQMPAAKGVVRETYNDDICMHFKDPFLDMLSYLCMTMTK